MNCILNRHIYPRLTRLFIGVCVSILFTLSSRVFAVEKPQTELESLKAVLHSESLDFQPNTFLRLAELATPDEAIQVLSEFFTRTHRLLPGWPEYLAKAIVGPLSKRSDKSIKALEDFFEKIPLFYRDGQQYLELANDLNQLGRPDLQKAFLLSRYRDYHTPWLGPQGIEKYGLDIEFLAEPLIKLAMQSNDWGLVEKLFQTKYSPTPAVTVLYELSQTSREAESILQRHQDLIGEDLGAFEIEKWWSFWKARPDDHRLWNFWAYDNWFYEYHNGCKAQRLQDRLVEQYLNSQRDFVVRRASTHIEDDAPVIERGIFGCMKANQDPFLVRLAVLHLNPSKNAPRIYLIRELAVKLCLLDFDFCSTRENIHGHPSALDLKTTASFLESYREARTNAHLAPERASAAERLLRELSLFYGVGEFERQIGDSRKELEKILGRYGLYYGIFHEIAQYVDNRAYNLEPSLRLAASIRKALEGTGKIQLPEDSWLVLIKLQNTLLQHAFAEAGTLVSQVRENSELAAVVNRQNHLRALAEDLSTGVYAEGMISESQYRKFRARVKLTSPVAATTSTGDRELSAAIGEILEIARKKIHENFSDSEDFLSQFRVTAKDFSEDLARSSLVLHLSELREIIDSQQNYKPLQIGTVSGKLRLIRKTDIANLTTDSKDILVFDEGVNIPTTLGVFAGVITSDRQPDLGHVALKAKNRGSPGAYSAGASKRSDVLKFLGENVRLSVKAESFELSSISERELSADLKTRQIRLQGQLKPQSDLSVLTMVDLTQEQSANRVLIHALGSKAFNYGELYRLFGSTTVRPGLAIPFSFYKKFLELNGFDREINQLLADPSVKSDSTYRKERLKKLREKIENGSIDPQTLKQIADTVRATFGSTGKVRLRSSTNSEDLPGFNGAGLYDSAGAKLDSDKSIAKNLRKVWASVWNDRAFDERELFGIDHSAVVMGILVHESYSDEAANGVALTATLGRPQVMTIQSQHGESSITNPVDGSRPDEIEVEQVTSGEPRISYIGHTSLQNGTASLSNAQILDLAAMLKKIHEHFKPMYNKTGAEFRAEFAPEFVMDVEFKLVKDGTGAGSIMIKQARPLTVR